ncbi:MAG: polynucleotide adenylyltransferase PcnB [Wenzhouxiangellaceae bacterium]
MIAVTSPNVCDDADNKRPDESQQSRRLNIIPREEHGIDPHQVCKHATTVINTLQEAGFAAYLVGGGVRDLLLGRLPKDFDVATSAHPEQVKSLFSRSRLIGRRFRLVHVCFGRYVIEVATFRGNGGSDEHPDRHIEDGHLIRDNVFGSEEEDALRRDFTINALMYDPRTETVRDYVGGYGDLRQGILRMIGDPETRYREDPVRMIRAVRFISSRGLTLERETEKPIQQLASLLAKVAPARLFEEVCKVFLSGHGSKALPLMAEYGLFQELFPATRLEYRDGDWHAGKVLTQALINTDQRVKQDKPVTPGFLMAAMLWQPLQEQIEMLEQEGLQGMDAVAEAIDVVFEEQIKRVAIPRRFTSIAREIWLMQPRFRRMRGKRVLRLLAERRFRAAYDFLLLRALEIPELEPIARWWTEIQEVPRQQQEQQAMANATASRGPRRRRRRRGGQRGKAAEGKE